MAKKFKKPLLPSAGTQRLKQFATSVTDLLMLDPRIIKREVGFNKRLPLELAANVRKLKPDVAVNGVKEPLTIRKDGDTIYLVNGDSRLTSVEELIAEGRWPEDPKNPGFPMPVPCKPEGAGLSRVDRFFLQLSLNNSKDFGPFEKGLVYAAIQEDDPSVTGSDIAARTGETKQAVSNALRLVKHASPALVDAIRAGTMADSTALEIISQAGEDHAAQDSLLARAAEAAAHAGREKIMPKDMKAAAAAETPPARPEHIEWSVEVIKPKKKGGPAWLGYVGRARPDGIKEITAEHAIKINPSAFPNVQTHEHFNGTIIHVGWSRDPDTKGWRMCCKILNYFNQQEFYFYTLISSSPVHPSLRQAFHEEVKEALFKAFTCLHSRDIDRMLDAITAVVPLFSTTFESQGLWEITERESIWNKHGICEDPSTISLTGKIRGHDRLTCVIRYADGGSKGYRFGYAYSCEGESSEYLPDLKDTPHKSMAEAVHAGWQALLQCLTSTHIPDLTAPERLALYQEWEADLLLMHPLPDAPAGKPTPIGHFNQYQMTGSPAEPLEDGTYHETERLVLEDSPADFPLLHLLVHATPSGACYGYRFGDLEQLPDPGLLTANLHPADGFSDMLDAALTHAAYSRKDEVLPKLKLALADAIDRYYPESGDPEDSILLAFAAGTAPAKADPGAIERIQSAGSTERDGTSTGLGNDGRWKDIESQAKKLDRILEEIGEAGDPDRLATANLIYNFLMAESSPASVKNHLLGKA